MDLGKIGKMVCRCLWFRKLGWHEGGTFLTCENGPGNTNVLGLLVNGCNKLTAFEAYSLLGPVLRVCMHMRLNSASCYLCFPAEGQKLEGRGVGWGQNQK